MNEKEFITDLWDIINGNKQYITAEKFKEKYSELTVEVNLDDHYILLSDMHNEWRLTLQKVWCDNNLQ